MSEDGTAQGGVRAQTMAPLYAGKMGSYQPKTRRAPPCPEPLTLLQAVDSTTFVQIGGAR